MGALFVPICLSYVGLALFLYGFFLTRRELDLKASSKVLLYTKESFANYEPVYTHILLNSRPQFPV